MARRRFYRFGKPEEPAGGFSTGGGPGEKLKRSKADARAAYDRLSRWYDLIASPAEREFRQAGLRRLDLQPDEYALEIGFGTGQAVLSMAEAVGPYGKVYGVDLSGNMNRIARTRVSKAGFDHRVELVCSDGACLPLGDKFFDALFMSFTLELFDTVEIPACLNECRRVLRSSGRMCVVALAKVEKPGLAVRLYEWLHRKLPRLVDCRPIYVETALVSAGFNVVEHDEMTMWGLPVNVVLAVQA
jgi:ubiquinone/menaquinone biosynthesis C-methylase UbiE